MKADMADELRGKSTRMRWILYFSIALGILLLLFAAFNLTIRLDFLLGDDLIIHLTPEQSSLALHYGEQKEVAINLSVETPPYCASFCTYALLDKSRSTILDSGNLTLKPGEPVTKAYVLSPSRAGRGQDIYSFDASCHAVRSFFCPANEEMKYRSSFITLNYDLTEQDKLLKEELKGRILPLLSKLHDIDVALKIQSQRIVILASSAKMDDIQEHKAAIEETFFGIILKMDGLRNLWGSEAYAKLSAQLDSELEEAINKSGDSVSLLSIAVSERLALHNGLVREVKNAIRKTNAAHELYTLAAASNNSELREAIRNFSREANWTQWEILTLKFGNYDSLRNATGFLKVKERDIKIKSLMLRSEGRVRSTFLISKERDYRCFLAGKDSDCTANATIPAVYGKFLNETEKEWADSTVILDTCNEISTMKVGLEKTRNETSKRLALENKTLPTDEDFNRSAENFSLALLNRLFWEYKTAIAKINDSNFTRTLSAMPNTSIIPSALNETERNERIDYLLAHLEISAELKKYEAEFCLAKNSFPYMILDNLSEALEPINLTAQSSIDATLSDNPPVCCIFGQCGACCTQRTCATQEETFPLIFLHGHAFEQASSPAYSLDAFNLIQYALEEEGYLNAGIVTPNTKAGETVSGEWGLSGKPISIKASYYLDTYREGKEYVIVPTKSESIDTYALRLRDIIEVVRERTGKEKVNIVAHSMGGLVARRYIQIFGDEKVNKLVMIATPNQGIASRATELCPLFGEQKECTDMQQGSLFLNKLNDPAKQPKSTELYTIAGVGCVTDKKDGDGVIIVENTRLTSARQFNISGSCGGFLSEPLHTEILNIRKYPELRGILKGILKGES